VKVTLISDYWLVLDLSTYPNGGRRVELPAKTVRRWARLSEAVNKVQAEFRAAYEKELRES